VRHDAVGATMDDPNDATLELPLKNNLTAAHANLAAGVTKALLEEPTLQPAAMHLAKCRLHRSRQFFIKKTACVFLLSNSS